MKISYYDGAIMVITLYSVDIVQYRGWLVLVVGGDNMRNSFYLSAAGLPLIGYIHCVISDIYMPHVHCLNSAHVLNVIGLCYTDTALFCHR